MAFNSVTLIGRLVKDPELKEYDRDNGERFSVATGTLAVDRLSYKKDNKVTDFIPFKCFNGPAKYITKCGKGALVRMSGKLRTDSYTDKEGNKRYTWFVEPDSYDGVEKLDPWKKKEEREAESAEKALEHADEFMDLSAVDDAGLPFN